MKGNEIYFFRLRDQKSAHIFAFMTFIKWIKIFLLRFRQINNSIYSHIEFYVFNQSREEIFWCLQQMSGTKVRLMFVDIFLSFCCPLIRNVYLLPFCNIIILPYFYFIFSSSKNSKCIIHITCSSNFLCLTSLSPLSPLFQSISSLLSVNSWCGAAIISHKVHTHTHTIK